MNTTTHSQDPAPTNNNAGGELRLSWRTAAILLLVIIAAMTFLWKPWTKPATARTITVEGEATVTAAPDKYDFQPSFQSTDLKAVTATGNEAVARLKSLGVKDADIKTSITGAGNTKPSDGGTELLIYPRPNQSVSNYSITATVKDKDLAQKISDYLATTSATGQVTPYATFSKQTADKLELDARSKASDNAKSKASITAKQLGARVGKVIKISDNRYGGAYASDATEGRSASSTEPAKAIAGPVIQPGTNEVVYSFTVEFELK